MDNINIMNTNNYQLFKKIPNDNFIIKFAEIFGIENLSQMYYFTLEMLEEKKVVDKILEIKDELDMYYIRCKYETYILDLNIKKAITVLRHFLKIIDYKCVSREKYSNGQKFLIYRICKINPSKNDLIVYYD